jgi:hypothetical protein
MHADRDSISKHQLMPYFVCAQTLQGGAGGGAIELIAANDLTIGNLGAIHTDGGHAPNATAHGWDAGAYVKTKIYMCVYLCTSRYMHTCMYITVCV